MGRFTLITLFITTYSWNSWAQDIYLEGVSVLGDKKVAYLTIDNEKVSVEEGEDVATWKVDRIERRAIFLISPEGKETELQLQSTLQAAPEEKAVEAVNAVPVIKDEDVPDGYRKIKTPFGDYVILKDYSAPQPTEESTNNTPIQTESATTPEPAESVRTPFGDIPKSVD